MNRPTITLLIALGVSMFISGYNWVGWSACALHAHELREELDGRPTITSRRQDCASERFVIEAPIGTFAGRAPTPSDYPEPQFRVDCDAVCEAHWPTDPPGRTVMVDHDHLVCVCFRPGTSWGLTRYRAWAREQGE